MKLTIVQKLILSFFSVMIFIAVIISCRKLDIPNQDQTKIGILKKFFNQNSNIDTTVKAIIESIKRQNDKRNFVVRLTNTAGYPLWDKAKVSSKDDQKQVFIPFVLENGIQTRAMLIAKLSGRDTLYHLLYAPAYKKYGFDKNIKGRWTAREVFSAFAIFDNEIFGHEEFCVKDDRLLSSDVNVTNNEPIIAYMKDSVMEQARIQTVHTFIHSVTWVMCGECNGARSSQNITARTLSFPAPCCNATYYNDVVIFWFDDSEGGGSEWGWYPPEGGAGGGEPCPGCNWDNTNPCEEQDPNQPQFPCDDGWLPVMYEVKEPFNINEYDDTVGIGNGLATVYPCIAAYITDSLTDINWLAQIAGGNVFEDSAYMHLTFDTSTTWTQQNDTIAATKSDTLIRIINGQTHFTATISLNGWYLRNATKEYMISTIIHEAMHAVFRLRWGEYKVWLNSNPHIGTIDSFL